jgi:prefoldin subunit 5
MKLNPYSKRYLQHFKYLKSIQAESITSAYTFHPNVLSKRKKRNKLKPQKELQSKNLQTYLKEHNIIMDYIDIIDTDLKVLSTNTNTKALKHASLHLIILLNGIPCLLMISYQEVYLYGKCNSPSEIVNSQFQIGNEYYMGSEKIHENIHFFQQRTEETKSIVDFLKELQDKELQEEELFMYSTVIDNPELYKNAYNLTKHVQELISTNKKIHHLITYITNYA